MSDLIDSLTPSNVYFLPAPKKQLVPDNLIDQAVLHGLGSPLILGYTPKGELIYSGAEDITIERAVTMLEQLKLALLDRVPK